MARIVFINSVCYGSTGSICKNLYKMAEKQGHECIIAYGRGDSPEGFKTYRIGNKLNFYMHALYARLTDKSGNASTKSTLKMIEWLEEYKPDIIHMHNIHGYYLNIVLFFEYLKKHPEIKKIWTLHDCWSFTGHCAYYSYVKCDKWMNQCEKCGCTNDYPKAYRDNSKNNYLFKKRTFMGVENLVLVTPSEWLKKDVQKSFLKNYRTLVINNGIDLSVFSPTKISMQESIGVNNKKIILGVASVWDNRKGLQFFYELSKLLSKDYQIVLIGLTNKQIQELPKGIVGIERTENVHELVNWYSSAHILFNPTLEDNYPTVNLEAQACGTYVVAFDSGGTRETIKYANGLIVKSVNEVIDILENNKVAKVDLSDTEEYDFRYWFGKYLELYSEV